MSISDKKQEIIDNYHCYDQHGECLEDCDNCMKALSDDLEEYANLIIQELKDKIVKELKNEKNFWKDKHLNEKARSYSHAIEIVKREGKNWI